DRVLERDELEHIGYIPEQPAVNAVAPSLSAAQNLAARHARKLPWLPRWDESMKRDREALKRFDVRPADPEATMQNFSGGNLQKLVLCRWRGGELGAVVACFATRGLDVVTSAAVLEHLRERAAQGAAVVLISEDLDLLIASPHRVVVLFDGRIVSEHAPDESERKSIGLSMVAGSAAREVA